MMMTQRRSRGALGEGIEQENGSNWKGLRSHALTLLLVSDS
jgi:hypothetical protein